MPGSQVNRGPDRRMLRRILALCVLFGLLAFPALILRLYRLQITDHEYYEALAIGQQLREAPTVIARGGIYDRSGKPLALSASVENVFLSPAEIDQNGEDRELIASGLARILDLDERELLEKSRQSGSWYVTVKRRLEREEADAVRAELLNMGVDVVDTAAGPMWERVSHNCGACGAVSSGCACHAAPTPEK